MGTHISFIRSSTLDSLNIGNLLQMELGGNTRASEFFRSRGVKGKVDYNTALAMQYKEILKTAVQRAAESNPACLAIDPNSMVLQVEECPGTSVTDLSLHTSEEEEDDYRANPAEVFHDIKSPEQEPPAPIVQSSTTSAAPPKPIPSGKQSAKLIDDFDFDSVPETVPASQQVSPAPQVSYTSSVVRPTSSIDFAVTGTSSRSMSSSQFWADDPPSSRSSPRLADLTEKGKELVSKGFKAGKDLYNSFMQK